MDHPCIVKLYEYFVDKRYVYMITELCTGGELYRKIIQTDHMKENFAVRIFKQILQAINYCHAKGIAHRDLKVENFLFESS